MNKVLAGIGLLCFSSLIFAESETQISAATITVNDVIYGSEMTFVNYRLPQIISQKYPQAARRINDAIFSRYLMTLPGKDPYSALKNAAKPKTEGGIVNIPFLDYAIGDGENNDKYISLAIISEFCGAYCETSNISYSFDVTHGTQIQLDDIFVPEARALLEKVVKTDIRSKINTLIEEQKKNPVPTQQQNEDYVDYQLFYGDCWAMNDAPIFEYTNTFSLIDGKLIFQNGRCSNHANRALDELGEFVTEISLEKYTDLLTPYGKSLLIEKDTATIAPPPRFFDRMLYGTINNKLPIAIGVDCHHKSAYGAYYYTKFGQPLVLTGDCENGNTHSVKLTFNSGDAPKEEINLTLKNGQYQGTWQSEGKSLPIIIELP